MMMDIVRRIVMAIKSAYHNHIFFLFNETQDKLDLDSAKYQREVNYSKKLRPSLDDFKFSREFESGENNEDNEKNNK